jgi:hypothetical protein
MASTCGLTWPITVAYTPQQHFTVLANTRFKKGLLLPVLAAKPPKKVFFFSFFGGKSPKTGNN